MRQINKIIAVIFAYLLLVTTTVYADTQKSGSEILNESYDYLGSLDRYTVASKVIFDIKEDGETYEEIRIIRVKVDRPNKVRIDNSGNLSDRSVYLSNGVFTILDNKEHYYTQVNTPDSIDDALDHIIEEHGIVTPVTTLLYSDMSKYVKPKKVTYFGKRTIEGVECNYIAFKRHNNDVHLWIEDSASPLVRKAAVYGKDFQMRMASRWNIKPSFSDDVFAFKASTKASKISIVPAK